MTARVMFMPRYVAWCDECGYDGPARVMDADAQVDADRHNEEVHRVAPSEVVKPYVNRGEVVDLLAALQRSVDAAKARRNKNEEVHGGE